MIQVPLDKIIPMEEALIDINKIMEEVRAQKSLYVITKDGKPHSAIIDIDMLEHLPEMNHEGDTRPIQEIGQNNSYEGIAIEKEESSPISQGITTPEPQPITETKEFTPSQVEPIPQKAQEDLKDALAEDIGPWSNPDSEGKGPQDLDI
jgi:prevent-host-death family protein